MYLHGVPVYSCPRCMDQCDCTNLQTSSDEDDDGDDEDEDEDKDTSFRSFSPLPVSTPMKFLLIYYTSVFIFSSHLP